MILWLVEIEMLNPIHELEWALSFKIPRKLKRPRISRISTILDQPLGVLNKQVVRKCSPLTTVFQLLEGVQNVTTLDLNMDFDTVQLDLNAPDKESIYKRPKFFPSNKYVSQRLGICL